VGWVWLHCNTISLVEVPSVILDEFISLYQIILIFINDWNLKDVQHHIVIIIYNKQTNIECASSTPNLVVRWYTKENVTWNERY
jgi:hypothetical protein